MIRRLAIVAALLPTILPALAGCGSPLLHGVDARGRTVTDSGLVGTWITEDADAPTQVRAEIAPTDADGIHRLSLVVRHEDRLRSTLAIDLALVEFDGVRCADLFLSPETRDELVERYGFLALPVHQVVRLDRDGDSLRVAMLNESWLRAHGTAATHERMTIGGGEITVITASATDVAQMLADHASQDGVFGEPMLLRRSAGDAPP